MTRAAPGRRGSTMLTGAVALVGRWFAPPRDHAPDFGDGEQLQLFATRRRLVTPPLLLFVMVACYVAVFGRLTWAQQSNFGTFGYDMGIYDQGIWLLSRFESPFVTVRGLHYFGHHVNLITVLFVPFYWLGAGPHFLYLAETLALAAGAIPIWLLARDRLGDPWSALALAAAYLLYPAVQWINWWHFHPDALIITPLLWAYWLATKRRWGWFWVAVVVALLCKEDAALAVLVLGALVARRQDTRIGLATVVLSGLWFVVATRIVIPRFNGVGPLYENLFPGFGDSVPEIAYNMIRHPSRVLDLALRPDRHNYYRQLLIPVALFPLGAPAALLIAGPQLVINVVSGHGYTHDIRYHYSAIVVAGVFLATVEATAKWRRVGGHRLACGLVAGLALATNVAWSPSPIGTKYRSGIWAQPQPKHRAVREALALVPASAGVSASYLLVPHLTHRKRIYEFPNPWVVSNWAIAGENPPQPAAVQYLVLDTALNGEHQSLVARLLSTGFVKVFERDGIVVARRR